MKRLCRTIRIPILLICCSCTPQDIGKRHDSGNPYGLEIVQTVAAYQKSVRATPDKAFVNLRSFIPLLMMDIRYATTNNFTKKQVYAKAMAFLRRPAAEKLREAQTCLADQGLGLIVFDAYRPYSDTIRFYEIRPDPNFCADPRKGSRHNRGCAVDVSLYDLKTGRPLPMPSDFDDFSERAHPNDTHATAETKANRDRLISMMARHGFTVFPTEWWHYDFTGWEKFPLTDLSFESLSEQTSPSAAR